MSKSGAIWWAIDPFNDDIGFQMNELAALMPLAKKMSTVIQPVTFIDTYRSLAGEGNFFPLMPLYADSYEAIKKIALERLNLIYKKSDSKILKEVVFLTHKPEDPPSLQDRVETISKAAAKAAAAFVVIRTHSRRGVERFYMGSFAETFLLYADLPTLVLRSDTKVSTLLRRVIFPTDFSAESKKAFLKLLPLFSRMKTSLVIAHVSPDLLFSKLRSSAAVDIFKAHQSKLKKSAEALVALAKKKHVKANFKLINVGFNEDSSEALLQFGKEFKADLIALAAKSSPIKTALAGALTRKLVRSSDCPVLIHRIK